MMRYTHRAVPTALTNEQLMAKAPSIFADRPWEGMSARYTFIPTINVVDKMRAEGFQPYSAVQSRTRVEGKGDFTKHMIRFRDVRQGDNPLMREFGSIFPELIYTNSHDGTSTYRIDGGLWRQVCLNGLHVCEENISQVKVRHSGSLDNIIEASYELVEGFPAILESVERFGRLQLSAPQREAFAESALSLRYDDVKEAPIQPSQVIRAKRSEDTAPTLWNTMNVVQEHMINGGDRGFNRSTQRRVTTRPVTGIAENTRLNKALWTLTAKMAELVA